MCTLVVAWKIFLGFPVVVAANRDEMLDRPSEPSLIRGAEPKIFAPKDLRRGGTWMGVNECGVFAGITNRVNVKPQWGKMSRGAIVNRVLGRSSAREAFDDLADLNGEEMNGFYLVICDRDDMFLLEANGKFMERYCYLGNGELFVTNQGNNTVPAVSKRLASVSSLWNAMKLNQCEPRPENLKPILEIHDEGRHGTCINLPEENYGTKSSSIVRLSEINNEWQYWHRERPARDAHVCSVAFGPMMVLKINSRRR